MVHSALPQAGAEIAEASHQILPELVSGRGTADRRSGVEGKQDRPITEAGTNPLPRHHPLRGRSPSPSTLGEEL
ncbi:MAG: hypothetical protein A2792_16715 [Sphingomonadales bacterium RIFCSPHIGHO2_01_FULL_65_20]|nr:MAG: hypothetical protein A2792_16715 [Sphingomonadales bacterium RIFCSPHIGHO2_01_FULL_65_20]